MFRKWGVVGFFIMIVVLGMFNIQQEESSAEESPEKGMMAPDFTLTSVDGETIKLSSLRGKKVVLNFWTSWCPPCQEELPDIQAFAKTTEDKSIVTIGVNLTGEESGKEAVHSFVKQSNLTYPILYDMNDVAQKLYRIVVIPTTYVIDEDGVIKEKIVGPVTKEQLLTITESRS
ncbi:TlpA disulfide reductase family protein [Bacillus sp. FJAT-47783]|uniref:TlpA disulfide reductase family protein n=1 Tax=Bacillus sp. FJAT-47783 TaxID=2922712 RepID=UPI001FAC6599|nr:TlpA disulfide reductase family protein [Bacillus sp. FJAT-47783]